MSKGSHFTSNQCDVCGEPATQFVLKDPFGKSNEMRPLCGQHGLRIRDPADVAEIERLTRERDEAISSAQGFHHANGLNMQHVALLAAERDRLWAALQEIIGCYDDTARHGDVGPLAAPLIIARDALGGKRQPDETYRDPETLTAALERAKPWLVWSPDSPGPQWQLNEVKAEVEKALSGPSRPRIRPGVMERLQKLERPSEKAATEPLIDWKASS